MSADRQDIRNAGAVSVGVAIVSLVVIAAAYGVGAGFLSLVAAAGAFVAGAAGAYLDRDDL